MRWRRRRRTARQVDEWAEGDTDDPLGPWAISEGTSTDGQAVIARTSLGVRSNEALRRSHPIRIGIALPYTDRFTVDDDAAFHEMEDLIEAKAGVRAVLVSVITTPTCRELVFHAATADWIPEFHAELRHELSPHDVQVFAEHDPEWTLYAELIGEAPA